MPGPGSEDAFQKYCGAEYERVHALALEMIRANTAIEGDLAETMARKLAAAHADVLYGKLTDRPRASKRRNLIERPRVRERVAYRNLAATHQ